MSGRLVRLKVKDFASCFYACRFPLEDEPEISKGSPPRTEAVSDGECGKDRGKIRKRSGPPPPPEPDLAEEDYIVFCFREDGAIDVINEGRSSEDNSDEFDDRNSAVGGAERKKFAWFCKLHCDECENFIDTNQPSEIKEKQGEQRTISWPKANEIKEMEHENGSKVESFESCDSNPSDTSTSSFAFPVLGPEWIGSPDHMPRAEHVRRF